MKHHHLKVCIVGGASSYTPELLEGLARSLQDGLLPISEIVLFDINETRVAIVVAFCKRMFKRMGVTIALRAGESLEDSVKDARFVITTIRVGGMEARIADEHLGIGNNVIGQETVGIGGFAKALRTIPRALEIAQAMEQFAPEGILLNFTNPAGIVTEALLKHSSIPSVGLCNVPLDCEGEIVKACNCRLDEVALDYVGLNHLGWIRGVTVRGEDVWDTAFPYYVEHTAKEEWGSVPGLMGRMREVMREQNIMLTYYLQYYLFPQILLGSQLRARKTRGEVIRDELDPPLWEAFADASIDVIPDVAKQRGGSGYSRAALRLMRSIWNNTGDTQIVCCRNNGALSWLEDDVSVELPARIGERGAEAISQAAAASNVCELMTRMKLYESTTVEAAVRGNMRLALTALEFNPLIPDDDALRHRLLGELVRINREHLHGTFLS